MFNNPVGYNDPDGHAPCKPGYRCVTPIADKRDMTTWLVAALVDSAESPEMQRINELNAPPQYDGINKAKAYAEFESYVKDGAKYDVKDKMELLVGKSIKIGNNWYEFSTAGNILYGFYGKAAGFNALELHAGAGKAQLDDYERDPTSGIGDWSTLFDTEDDYAAVKFGIYLYDNYYKDDGELTTADLLAALESFSDANKMALVEKPKGFQPRYYEYPVNKFYQME
ncbi:MAG: polymorphic toxin type 44 domain-containing protein [Anaerolineales bacterium]|nr:polymorphic toxin type 44 domain-containing protein [Anaerolineales bacterium]